MSDAATLEFRSVTKRYPGQAEPAVEELSLTVPAGEICVLVGPSGCGKTTAMRMVNRMIDITDGDILLDGRSVGSATRPSCAARSATRSSRSGLFPHLHASSENIATVPRLLGWDKQRIRAARRRAARARRASIRRRRATATPPSSPAASASASAWRARSPSTRR